jgi:hypothetical protein
VDPAEHLELIAQEIVDLAPRAHVQHAAREVRTTDRDLLADAGTHADEPDEVDVAQAEVIEQPDRVRGVQRHRRRLGHIVVGVADAPVVEQHDLMPVDETARQVSVVLVTECAPAAHAQDRVAAAQYLVIHAVTVDDGAGHRCTPRTRGRR